MKRQRFDGKSQRFDGAYGDADDMYGIFGEARGSMWISNYITTITCM